MAKWLPVEEWKGKDAFIIGGGTSLRGFDWNRLRGKHTIGCNTAFELGEDICEICVFSDLKWYEHNKEKLWKFKNRIVTNCSRLQTSVDKKLCIMDRRPNGLHKDALGSNWSTGAAAINLALVLGAKRVFLLGFDLKEDAHGRPNWHNKRIIPHRPVVYDRFMEGFKMVAEDLKKVFPGRKVINLNPDSRIEYFPKAKMEEYI